MADMQKLSFSLQFAAVTNGPLKLRMWKFVWR